jgi:triosephosphate isomerase
MKKLVIANWKMNGTCGLVEGFAGALSDGPDNLIIALPFIFLSRFRHLNDKIKMAAQDCSVFEDFGAHTGEISARMLHESGISYVILGHSERRASSSLDSIRNINAKLRNVTAAGLCPILCVSEQYEELIDDETMEILAQQKDQIILAYEPISAIGTGKTPSTPEITKVISEVKRKYGGIRTVYGGSVTQHNAAEILGISEIDGVLVGGASLSLNELMGINKSS